jgi:hypothetical protein
MRYQSLSARLLGSFSVLTALSCSCAHSEPQATAPVAEERLSIRLGFSSEGNYTDIAVAGPTLQYTYNRRNSLEKRGDIGSMMRQAPHWTQADLTTEKVSLSAQEVNDLKGLLVRTKFFSLKPAYGEMRGRYYATTIVARLNGKTHTVSYHSGMHGGPPPTAFETVKGRLLLLVNAKCRHKVTL